MRWPCKETICLLQNFTSDPHLHHAPQGGHDLAGIQLYDVDRLKALVTKDGEKKFNKNICGCKEDDCSTLAVSSKAIF